MPSCTSLDAVRTKPRLAHTPQPDEPPPDEPGEPDAPPIGDPPPQPGEVPHSKAQPNLLLSRQAARRRRDRKLTVFMY
jgi:hypothetical protein